MKKLRLALVGLLALGTGVQASLFNTINVTTTADEDGTNPAACSLREAVEAVNTLAPYGGCPTGLAFYKNVIQLEADDYVLTRGQLVVKREMILVGKDKNAATHQDQIDPMTRSKPRRVRPDLVEDPAQGPVGTSITADVVNRNRLINSIAELSVRDVVLNGTNMDASGANPVDGNGGVIYASAALNLSNVVIRGGLVSDSLSSVSGAGNGGAIYLTGDGSVLTLNDVTLESNQAANSGGAIAMLCSLDLNPYAAHTISIKRSLFKANRGVLGAGAIDFCGKVDATIAASTLSRNISFAAADPARPDSGAISYVQTGNQQFGVLTLDHVTAVEQNGHVLALRGIAGVSLSGSLLGFGIPATWEVCFNPDRDPDIDTATDVDAPMTASPRTGVLTAVTDTSCDELLHPNGANKVIPPSVTRADVLSNLTSAPYPPGGPFGLTDYYFPIESTPTYILDQGGPFANCTDVDQRNVSRNGSGTGCDIGAVERLGVHADDDNGENTPGTDRRAVINVLANDGVSESLSGPAEFSPFAPDDPATTGVNEGRPVELVDDGGGRCKWSNETLADGTTAGRIVVTSPNGALREADNAIVCKYRVHDTSGAVSAPAEIVTTISNVAPIARNDVYQRPVGTAEIVINPLENDDDSGDGKYGNEPVMKADGSGCEPVSPAAPAPFDTECQYTNTPNWVDFYPPVEITTPPQLGEIQAVSVGLCPGKVTATCYWPPLRYIAKNSLAPFTDSFSYRVFDQDEQGSAAATVIIMTNASDLEHGGGGGSFDMLGGLILGLLGLRRLRRL